MDKIVYRPKWRKDDHREVARRALIEMDVGDTWFWEGGSKRSTGAGVCRNLVKRCGMNAIFAVRDKPGGALVVRCL